MKKHFLKKATLIALAASMTIGAGFTSLAAGWKSDENGWWWEDDHGGYYANCWAWLDGNGDGVAESYCFDARGYLYADTTTPDGYKVNADGAWVKDGVVQTKSTSTTDTNDASKSNQNDDYSGTYVTSYATYILTYNKSTNSIHQKSFYNDGSYFEDDYVYNGIYAGIIYFDLDSDEDKDCIMFAGPGRMYAYDGMIVSRN